MAGSEVDVCNLALMRLGLSPITALDDGSARAEACDAIFDQVRDAELRKYPWRFSLKRETLAPDETSPSFGPSYSYTLPADFIRMGPIDDDANLTDLDWRIEGGAIVTDDATSLDLVYVARIEDVTRWSPDFVNLVALRLAAVMAPLLTQSNPLKQTLEQEYALEFTKATAVSASENVRRTEPEDELLSVRY